MNVKCPNTEQKGVGERGDGSFFPQKKYQSVHEKKQRGQIHLVRNQYLK